MPHELVALSEQEILVHLRKAVKRAVGLSKIKELKKIAVASIGIREGSDMAKLELRTLIDKYELIKEKFEELESNKINFLNKFQVLNKCWLLRE